MTKDEALKLALEALEELVDLMNDIQHGYYKPDSFTTQPASHAITAIKEALAQPEQEPVAFPRQAGKSTWTVDTAFIWRVKHTIDPDTPNDFTPSEEQIETVLLALEKIPSKLYTTPPQPKKQEPVAMRMPKVGDEVICIEDDSLGTVAYLTAGGSPEIRFDDGSHGTYMLREFAELFRYTSPPPQRKPLSDEEIADAVRESDFDWHYGWTLNDEEPNRFTKFAKAIEAAHGIKGKA